MGLKSVFQTRTQRSSGAISVIPSLEAYLLEVQDRENYRAPDVISPSSAGRCPREQVINRFYERGKVDPRVQRIFDNGTHVHLRLQRYLLEAGMLMMDEVPLRQPEYNVQGHTDGLLYTTGRAPEDWLHNVQKGYMAFIYDYLEENPIKSLEILEIKSINSGQFNALHTAKEEHLDQASTYLWCANERRQTLLDRYPTWKEFRDSIPEREAEHLKAYKFLPPKRRNKKVNECMLADALLYATVNPLERAIFLYENKDNQDIKEFVLKIDEDRLERLKQDFIAIEKAVAKIRIVSRVTGQNPDFERDLFKKQLPPMPERANGRYSNFCKWCDYTDICYGRR